MGCNCGSSSIQYEQVPRMAKQKDTLSGRWILDVNKRKLHVQSPIYDIYGDTVGYITKNESEDVVRIFARNVSSILE